MLHATGPKDYYSPYPTLTTMRGGQQMGQLPGLPPDATSQQLAVYYRQLAKDLGIKLPPRPAGATRGQSQVLDSLEGIEIAGGYLTRISSRLFRMMAAGGAMCEDLLHYNRLAIGIYEDQRDLLTELRDGGVQGIPLAPPWPPLFVGVGKYSAEDAESFWEIDCDEGKVIALATTGKPDGARIMLSKPCASGLGVEAGTVIAVTAGVLLLGSYIESWLQAGVEKDRIRNEAKRHVDNLRVLELREQIIEGRTKACVDKGGDYEDCLEAAHDYTFSLADLEDLTEAAKNYKPPGSKGWLWYIGLVAVVVGGVVVWRAVKGKKGRRGGGRRTGAEIIDVD